MEDTRSSALARASAIVAFGALLIVILACGSRAQVPETFPRLLTETVGTPGVAILYTDSTGTTQRLEPGVTRTYLAANANSCSPNLTTNYRQSLRGYWVEAVRVAVPGLNEPLYGLLAECGIRPNGTGPNARSYRIEVPQQYVDETSDGRVSVVYALYSDGTKDWVSWALYLSRTPFPERDAAGPKTTFVMP